MLITQSYLLCYLVVFLVLSYLIQKDETLLLIIIFFLSKHGDSHTKEVYTFLSLKLAVFTLLHRFKYCSIYKYSYITIRKAIHP